MNQSLQLLTAALRQGPASVKALAANTSLSESRVRELLKEIEGVESNTERPAKYWIPEVQAEVISAADQLEAFDNEGCPFCHAPAADQTAAGPDGTYLGDCCNLCHHCYKAYTRLTKVEVQLGKSGKGKRAPINPQYKIDAKVRVVEAAGGRLTYNKATRYWVLSMPGQADFLLSPHQFSLLTPETILA